MCISVVISHVLVDRMDILVGAQIPGDEALQRISTILVGEAIVT